MTQVIMYSLAFFFAFFMNIKICGNYDGATIISYLKKYIHINEIQ